MSEIKRSEIAAYNDQWQQPAKTEQWAFEQVQSKLNASGFFQYVAFPWATLIDSRRRGLPTETLDAGLTNIGPRTTLVRATVCQHIWALDLVDDFHRMGITDLFWCHAERDSKTIAGIRVHPFPLYPVQVFREKRVDPPPKRDLLFSFVGTYDSGSYRSKAREWILDLPQSSDYHVAQRTEWHFEQQTYRSMGDQNHTNSTTMQSIAQAADEYSDLMLRSKFALCPSGTGPNSIRFWEALGFGAIPVLIADSLKLPGNDATWNRAIVRVDESQVAISQLPSTLRNLAQNTEQMGARRMECRELWHRNVESVVENLINPIASTEGIDSLLNRESNHE